MSTALRVGMLTHSPNPRGGVVHAMAVAEALQDEGCEVTLFAPDASGEGFFRPPRCKSDAFRVARAPADMLAMVEQRIADYVEHLRDPAKRSFDVFHAHDGISGNALVTLKQRGAIGGFMRTVHHVDEFAETRLNDLQARSILSADAHFVVSNHWREHLARCWDIDAKVCGNGVDREKFGAVPDGHEAALRARLGLGEGPLFLCVGGVEARKNTLRILDAFRQVRRIRPDAELIIAGGASLLDHTGYRQAFEAALAEQGGAGVHKLGVIADADMARLYRLASALVYASVKEGFGLCVLEAMACGTPVVVSSIPPFTDYLKSDDAIWCDPYQPHAIADAMTLALADPLRDRLRQRGAHVAARFDWSRVARRLIPAYEKLRERADA